LRGHLESLIVASCLVQAGFDCQERPMDIASRLLSSFVFLDLAIRLF
jgi:hypothetical protein